MKNLESFFTDVRTLYQKYQADIGVAAYNIFRVLRLEEKEVFLHSRFIADLLNPDGEHGQKNLFLDLFLEELSFPQKEYQTLVVTREKYNIDILIETDKWIIIIENKVYHTDRPGQIKDYYEKIKNQYSDKKIYILYLNPYGEQPIIESYSGNGLVISDRIFPNTIHCISYGWTIYGWVQKCITITDKNTTLYQILLQYKYTLENLTGSMNATFTEELADMLKKDENYTFVDAIIEARKLVIEAFFWEELKNKLLDNNIKVIDIENAYYWKIDEVDGQKIFFWIIVNGIDGTCVGFGDEESKDVPIPKVIETNASKWNNDFLRIDVGKMGKWGWMAKYDCVKQIDFRSFANPATKNLIDKDKRTEFIKSLTDNANRLLLEYEQAKNFCTEYHSVQNVVKSLSLYFYH